MFASKTTGHGVRPSGLAAALILVLAAATAACSGGVATATSPSGVRPSDAAARQGGAPQRSFSVAVSPTSVTVGPSTLTFTVTNTSTTDNPNNAALGSVQIVIPAGLQVTSIGNFSGSKSWTYVGAVGQTITVGTAAGNNKLPPGESVTFDVDVTSTACATYNIANPQGSNEAPLTFAADSNWVYSGSALSVTVTGCTCDAPEAPSISHHYFTAPVSEGGLELPANDDRHHQVQVAVAHEQAEDKTFHGLSPCDPRFAAEVKAFVDAVMSQL